MNVILGAIDTIARERHLRHFRLLHRQNGRGELIIALIVSPEERPIGAPQNSPSWRGVNQLSRSASRP